MIPAKNDETTSKFVEVMPKKISGLFFSGTRCILLKLISQC